MHPMVGGLRSSSVSSRGSLQSRVGEIGFTQQFPQTDSTYGFFNMMTLEGVYGAHAAVSVDWI
jgi:hypothetical protein